MVAGTRTSKKQSMEPLQRFGPLAAVAGGLEETALLTFRWEVRM